MGFPLPSWSGRRLSLCAASRRGGDDPQDEGTGDEPESPTESAAKRFDLRSHLTHLFGTDLTLIPGIGASTALVLFTELGPDLSRFPSAAQFASWLNLCPQNKITGGKVISSQTGPGSNRAAQALRWATQSLYRSQSSLAQHFRRMRARLGHSRGDHRDRAQTGADHLPPCILGGRRFPVIAWNPFHC